MSHEILKGKRILLVEDDPSVRQALAILLSVDGHEVTQAENGKAACYRYVPGDFDLVITDYAMPQMKGDELARTIKCLVPSQPIIMVSAYAAQLWSPENPVDAILPKPFSLAELRQAIWALLAPAAELVPAHG